MKKIVRKLDFIGERGAYRQLFRDEDEADAIPKNERRLCQDLGIDFADFPLRLYCMRLRDDVVILFNGGVKDGETAQESSCSMQFYDAKSFAKRIDRAINYHGLRIDDLKGYSREDYYTIY